MISLRTKNVETIAMEGAGLDPREPVNADENRAALLLARLQEGNPLDAVLLELVDEYALENLQQDTTPGIY